MTKSEEKISEIAGAFNAGVWDMLNANAPLSADAQRKMGEELCANALKATEKAYWEGYKNGYDDNELRITN